MPVRFFTICCLALILFSLTACQLLPKNPNKPANVKDLSIEKKINPDNLENSVIETVPLMNSAVKKLYSQAQSYYSKNEFDLAIVSLERAYEIQPTTPETSQLLAEILLHKGDAKQSYYWANIATKNGPSKGKICEKSWRILAIAAEQLGYSANQSHALEKQENCLVKIPNRF